MILCRCGFASKSQFVESEEVVFMVGILLILFWIVTISVIINVALLAIIYNNWVNKQLEK